MQEHVKAWAPWKAPLSRTRKEDSLDTHKGNLILVSFKCWAPWVCKLHVPLTKNVLGPGCTLLLLRITFADLVKQVTNTHSKVLWDGLKLVPSQFIKYSEKWNEKICFYFWGKNKYKPTTNLQKSPKILFPLFHRTKDCSMIVLCH